MSIILIAEINLLLQAFILLLLVTAFSIMRNKQPVRHGKLMSVGVVLNLISFLLVMGPSLFSLGTKGSIEVPSSLFVITLGHASLGGIALALGIWLVATWHFQNSIQNCVRKKKVMLITFVVWTLALIMGISLFLLLYMLA